MMTTTTARVYVGTYGKYASGSIAGKWLDLDDYSSREEFYEACKQLHADEPDPECMFQDWEGIPKGLIGESWIDESVWEFLFMPEWKQELVAAFWSDIEEKIDPEKIIDAHRGIFDSEKDFAEDFAEQMSYVSSNDNNPVLRYIDWERYWDAELRHYFVTAKMPNGDVAIFDRDY